MINDGRTCFLAIEPCGCYVGAVMTNGLADGLAVAADFVAGWIRSGRLVDRVTKETANRAWGRKCEAHKPAPAEEQTIESPWSEGELNGQH